MSSNTSAHDLLQRILHSATTRKLKCHDRNGDSTMSSNAVVGEVGNADADWTSLVSVSRSKTPETQCQRIGLNITPDLCQDRTNNDSDGLDTASTWEDRLPNQWEFVQLTGVETAAETELDAIPLLGGTNVGGEVAPKPLRKPSKAVTNEKAGDLDHQRVTHPHFGFFYTGL